MFASFYREELRVFLILSFVLGICFYFALPFEPNFTHILYVALTLGLVSVLAFLFNNRIFYSFLLLTFFFFGMLRIAYDAKEKSKNFTIKENLGVVWVYGKLEEVQIFNSQKRIIVSNLNLWKKEVGRFAPEITPKKIRINVRTDFPNEIKLGDTISFKANISTPLINPPYIDGYDFAKTAFFNEIGGVGFAISPIQLKEKNNENNYLNELRNKLTDRLFKSFSKNFDDNQIGAVGVALITGEEGYINKNTLSFFRKSGLGHILSISGLHMTIVMSGIYFLIRKTLSYSQYIALNFNLAKIASIGAILAGFFYLIISGSAVPAERSYIMTSIFFLAILINRKAISILNVAWSSFFILLYEPNNIFSVSFILSFLSVLALISFFSLKEITRKFSHFGETSLLKKTSLILLGNLFSTLVAGFATSVIGAYYFGGYSIYSSLSNLVSIPITSLLIMPFGILSLVLAFFNLEFISASIAGIGIKLLVLVAEFVANFPKSYVTTIQFERIYLDIFIFSLIFLCVFKHKTIRLVLLGILVATTLIIFSPLSKIKQPDILISENIKLIALKLDDGYYFSSLQKDRFLRNQWSRILNIHQQKKFACENQENPEKQLCEFNLHNRKIAIINDASLCKITADVLINLSDIACYNNSSKIYFDRLNYATKNSVFVYLDKLEVKNAKNVEKRYWNSY